MLIAHPGRGDITHPLHIKLYIYFLYQEYNQGHLSDELTKPGRHVLVMSFPFSQRATGLEAKKSISNYIVIGLSSFCNLVWESGHPVPDSQAGIDY